MFEKNKKIYYPTNDYVFRRIFGTPGNEEITMSLLKCLILKRLLIII